MEQKLVSVEWGDYLVLRCNNFVNIFIRISIHIKYIKKLVIIFGLHETNREPMNRLLFFVE